MTPPDSATMPPALRVRDDFPGGNVCVLEIRNDGPTPEVHFTAPPKGGPEAMWFYFRIEPGAGATTPAGIRCVLHFMNNLLGGGDGSAGFHPVFKTARRRWERIDTLHLSTREDGQPLVAWDVPGGEGSIEVALCYPYGEAELDAMLTETAGAFVRDAIGATPQSRPLLRLRNMPGEPAGTTPGIYCLARQHAGETPGSWMLDGFLRQMAEAPEAPLVWATPMVDIDGVVAGLYGKDRDPWDFNRAWGSKRFPEALRSERGTHPMRHEVRCVQDDLIRWQGRCRPMLVLDFHAPTIHDRSGIYCFLRYLDDNGQPDEAHRPWAEAFRSALGDRLASDRFVRSGRYPSRWNTARVGDFVTEAMGVPQMTFEVPYASAADVVLTLDDYQQAGRRVAQAALDLTAAGVGPSA